MTMGVGSALMEDLAVDERLGLSSTATSRNTKCRCTPTIPHQDVIFLDEVDPMATPLRAKGVGELGICGVSAAMANAISMRWGRVRQCSR